MFLIRFFFKSVLPIFALGVIGLGFLSTMSRMPENNARSKVSRVKGDQRELAVALEAWHSTHGNYPVPRPLVELTADREGLERTGGLALEGWPGSGQGSAGTGDSLALPNLYDPCSVGALPYAYATSATDWVLLSPGPDGHYNLNPRDALDRDRADWIDFSYDPTNGSISSGDVVRTRRESVQ